MFGHAGPLLCGLLSSYGKQGLRWLWCVGFSLWLLLLWDTGSGAHGLSSCSFRDLEDRLSGCGAWA